MLLFPLTNPHCLLGWEGACHVTSLPATCRHHGGELRALRSTGTESPREGMLALLPWEVPPSSLGWFGSQLKVRGAPGDGRGRRNTKCRSFRSHRTSESTLLSHTWGPPVQRYVHCFPQASHSHVKSRLPFQKTPHCPHLSTSALPNPPPSSTCLCSPHIQPHIQMTNRLRNGLSAST